MRPREQTWDSGIDDMAKKPSRALTEAQMQKALALAMKMVREEEAEPAGPTVRELWVDFDVWGAANKKSWKSDRRQRWQHLEPFFGDRPAMSLTQDDLDAYRLKRGTQKTRWGTPPKPATRNHEVKALVSCLAWAVKRKRIPSNPIIGAEQEKAYSPRRYVLEEPQFAAVIRGCPNELARLIIAVAYDTGMRKGEILALQWEQVNLETREIILGDGDVKSGTGRVVPLTARALAAIKQAPRWGRHVFAHHNAPSIHYTTLHGWWVTAKRNAGIPNECKFHSLRHSCATLMRRRNVHPTIIKAVLGHKTEKAAAVYQQYSPSDWEQCRAAMDAGIERETSGRKDEPQPEPRYPCYGCERRWNTPPEAMACYETHAAERRDPQAVVRVETGVGKRKTR